MFNTNNYLVNVIVPVFNVEKYLSRCVESILSQTYQNIRIWLIDDGSTDDSSKICDRYSQKSDRVISIHKLNGGLSSARNEGLDRVYKLSPETRGSFISFVDSDDWIEPKYIEFLVNLSLSTNSDISQCGHFITFSDSYEVDKNKNHDVICLNRLEALESLCRNGTFDVTSWNKLYKVKLFEHIRFPYGKTYEDTATTYQLVELAERFAVSMTPLYHYVQRYTSIANGTDWSDSKLDLIAAGDQMADWICLHYPCLNDAAAEKKVYVRLSTLSQMVNTGNLNDIRAREMRRFICEHARQVLFDRRASRRDKLGVLMILPGFPWYRIAWSLYYTIRRRRVAGAQF